MHTFSSAACSVCKRVYGCLIYHKSLLGLVIVDGNALHDSLLKETKSATMNIFPFFLFSF